RVGAVSVFFAVWAIAFTQGQFPVSPTYGTVAVFFCYRGALLAFQPQTGNTCRRRSWSCLRSLGLHLACKPICQAVLTHGTGHPINSCLGAGHVYRRTDVYGALRRRKAPHPAWSAMKSSACWLRLLTGFSMSYKSLAALFFCIMEIQKAPPLLLRSASAMHSAVLRSRKGSTIILSNSSFASVVWRSSAICTVTRCGSLSNARNLSIASAS